MVQIPMSQSDPITEEDPGEATTGSPGITVGGTEPLPQSAIASQAPLTVVEGGRPERPIRMYATEKAKEKAGTDKTKGPDK